MRMTDYALDRFVAQGMSKLTECRAPDLSAVTTLGENLIPTFMLNSTLRVEVDNPERQYILEFLQRAWVAGDAYTAGRSALLRLVEGQGQRIRYYYQALRHFRHFVLDAYPAIRLLNSLTGKGILCETEDKSLKRLRLVNNTLKHVDERIGDGQLPDESVIAVALDNDGITACGVHLTFEEAAELVEALLACAEVLSDLPVPGHPVKPSSVTQELS